MTFGTFRGAVMFCALPFIPMVAIACWAFDGLRRAIR